VLIKREACTSSKAGVPITQPAAFAYFESPPPTRIQIATEILRNIVKLLFSSQF